MSSTRPDPMIHDAQSTAVGAGDRPLFLSVREAAVELGISPAFAYRLVVAGEIPSTRFGRRYLVPRAWIEQLATELEHSVALPRVVGSVPTRSPHELAGRGPDDANEVTP